MADVYFAYGKALLENAIVQNSVLGKEQEGGAAAAEEGMCCAVRAGGYCCRSSFFELMHVVGSPCVEPAPNSNKILSFSGDPEEEEEGEGGDSNDPAVDLFAEVSKAEAEEGEEEPGEHGADEAEPEDDFNAAWEVLDLARAIYEKQMDGDDEMRLKAADTLVMLGDISLETGAFHFYNYILHVLPCAEASPQRSSIRPSRTIPLGSR